MHKTWSSIEEVPYSFSRSSAKSEGHTGQKSTDFDKIGCSRTVTQDWIHWWLWNDAQSLKQNRRGALLFFKAICQISRSHGAKIRQFWPELSVSGLTQVRIHLCLWNDARWSIKFQGHTGGKIADFDPIWAFLDCNSSFNSPMDFKWCTKLDLV